VDKNSVYLLNIFVLDGFRLDWYFSSDTFLTTFKTAHLMSSSLVIGLVGLPGSGIRIAEQYLEKEGSTIYQIPWREDPTDYLRLVAIERILEIMEPAKSYVIKGIRYADEVVRFREHSRFKLIHIDANPRVRYHGMIAEGIIAPHVSYDTFLEKDVGFCYPPDGLEEALVFQMADVTVQHTGNRQQLERRVSTTLQFFHQLATAPYC